MKLFILNMLLASIVMAGFFNDEQQGKKAEMMENERLCKLFTKKVEDYKKTIRDDMLAKTTLASYEHRKSLFCAKIKGEDVNTSR
ncbi:MAG: hypothetical protein L3J47_02705 [Sulfurovum sp.]|nr:hypothetical protein [Sulfurovum sp.]